MLRHPDDAKKPPASVKRWVQEPSRSCKCVGVGAEYAEKGMFKPCSCVIKPGAPAHVVEYLHQHRFILF